jgi:hypothetical protein
VTKLLIVAMSWIHSRSKSHCVGSTEKSSGEEGELRRMGLSSPKTSGLITRPMTLAEKDARLVDDARRHLYARRTVSQGLGNAPPPLTLRMEAHDSLLYVICQSGVKEIFNGSCSPSLGG